MRCAICRRPVSRSCNTAKASSPKPRGRPDSGASSGQAPTGLKSRAASERTLRSAVATSTAPPVDAGSLNKQMVLENDVVFGSVNANRRHYEAAARTLAEADRGWLERLITRRVPLSRWQEALTRQPDDVKAVIDLTA